MRMIKVQHQQHAGSSLIAISALTAVIMISGVRADDSTFSIIPTPIQTLLFNGTINVTAPVNFTINATNTVNVSSVVSSSTVLPSLISPLSNITKPTDNVFFLEFKLLFREWSSALISGTSPEFILLANEITTQVDDLYYSRNSSMEYKGSRVIGYREGLYVSLKLEFGGVALNTSVLDPLLEYLRSGGSGGVYTDTVFIKLSKYADCIVNYMYTQLCHCKTKTYKMQPKCAEPDVRGGEACPHTCYNGHQVVGTRPCSWDDLDRFLCAAGGVGPSIFLLCTVLALKMFLI
ncbi:uncharacterized protein LOC116610396 isoform X2 [Nematostella vectensis]|uniref:uncharacterized protein LOC116610396 isoform X2 n=1 Tax=Nematostella vectensis TaxID=45351 RepID=UPI0020774239|nr:uncharacterized protein LOC116610396 isoform X2 [Nematostella vectensis]